VTTERRKSACRAVIASLSIALASCATESVGRVMGLSDERVAQLPQDVRPAYDVFAFKCSRCHSLSRPLNAQIYDLQHWRAYVARMRKHAGSAISEGDAEVILRFLGYWAEQKTKERREREGGLPEVQTSTLAGGAR
jgi:hypothetical protein